jgi:DNA-binding beta-propeller fold protein YncE
MGVCGPFTDISDPAFCPFVLEIFTLGITTGTTPTTYDPVGPVSRLQMAAFLSRTVDGALKRGSRRAALDRFWTPNSPEAVAQTGLGVPNFPRLVACDGADVWVPSVGIDGNVSRIRASDGKLLEIWTGAKAPGGGIGYAVLPAMGRIFVTGSADPGRLFRIDPSQTAGAVTTVASNLGGGPTALAFDGSRIWTANQASSVSMVTPGETIPWTVTTVTAGFSSPRGILFDGANVWVTDSGAGTLLKLDAAATILQTVTLGLQPQLPVFDGANIWVPTAYDSVSVVRASSGAVLATLTGNGLNGADAAAFDGERVLVTNGALNAMRVSLWKAADLTALGSFPTPGYPFGACSDGLNFWITLGGTNTLGRF